MKASNEIKKSKKLVESFKQMGWNAKLNEENGEISMCSSDLAKLKIILDGITDIK